MRLNKKKGIAIGAATIILIILISIALLIKQDSIKAATEKPIQTLIVSTDATGTETIVNERDSRAENKWKTVESNLYNCIKLEENIDYRNYRGDEAFKFYSKDYCKKRLDENKIRKKDLIKNKIKKFTHSFLLMSLNFVENKTEAIATAFYADVITEHDGKNFFKKYNYGQDGEAERYVQYRLIKELGNWVISEEKIIQ